MVKIISRVRQPAIEEALVDAGSDALMANLLAARGVVSPKELSISLANLLPPDQLTNNGKMAKFLANAIAQQKKILIVGDYDADGATATAVAVRGLRLFGAIVDFLVPNRFEYGYGLTPEIVMLAAEQKPDIILTVDNGIASIEGVDKANALGIEVLITDHHLPAETTPNAACIINPNQHGCDFASKNLAGVGVMFYALLALRAECRDRGHYQGVDAIEEPNLTCLLGLVALGTVADLVKLDANNRILVEQGLRRIRAGACAKGILALMHASGREYTQATAQDLGFYIGPRLNAAGRLDDMTLGINCLLSDDEAKAQEMAAELQALNQARRNIEADMQDSALLSLEELSVDDQFSLSLFDEEWHQGVIGILASRMKEKYHRPVIAFADAGDGLLKGSGRSIAGLHLRDALDLVTKHQPDLILKFGGHAMAAGLTIKRDDFLQFTQSFETVVRHLISADDLESVIQVDGALAKADFTYETANALERQVWGQGFSVPLFYDVFDVVNQRVLADKHLKLTLKKDDQLLDAIYFNQTVLPDATVKLVYQLQTNRFRGQENVQLNIQYAH